MTRTRAGPAASKQSNALEPPLRGALHDWHSDVEFYHFSESKALDVSRVYTAAIWESLLPSYSV